MNDQNEEMHHRLDAAKAAAPYVHPKLANIEHKGDVKLGMVFITRDE
jgi:hypothetical protein